jgi:hypothetical protein
MPEDFPAHQSIDIIRGENIYKEGDWWKAVLICGDESNPYLSIYLWHNDDGDWKRRNKYEADDLDSWTTDREVIGELLEEKESGGDGIDDKKLPMSDYLTASDFETIYKEDGWWKAVVSVIQKGDYELDTPEVVVYVWNKQDGDWHRRQKYSIKNHNDWKEEKETIEEVYDEYWEQSSDTPDTPPKPPSFTRGGGEGVL